MDDIQQLELPYQYEDEDDDVLRYLEFSDPDYTQPLLLPPPTPDDEPALDPSSTMLDSSFVLVDEGDGDLCFLDSNTAEVAASGLDCSGCHVLREVVHTNGLLEFPQNFTAKNSEFKGEVIIPFLPPFFLFFFL